MTIDQSKILVVRNDYDMITHYMFEWSRPLISEAKSKGFLVSCVDGKNVTKSQLSSRIGTVDYKFIIMNGHGTSDTFFGYGNNKSISLKDASIFRNKIVFVRACDCVDVLGREAVTKNCTAFIGYKYEFMNVRLTETDLRPQRDPITKPIWEISNTVPQYLIRGRTVSSSIQAARRRATKEMVKLLASSEPGANEALKAIIINDEGLTFHGNGSATINS